MTRPCIDLPDEARAFLEKYNANRAGSADTIPTLITWCVQEIAKLKAPLPPDIAVTVTYDHIMDRVRDALPRYHDAASPKATVTGEQLERVVEALVMAIATEIAGPKE